MKLRTHALFLFTALFLAGCASSTKLDEPQTTPGLGEIKATAIEVCRPTGQRAYLARLACSDGTRPTFTRRGSAGPRSDLPGDMNKEPPVSMIESIATARALKPGEVDHHIVDIYEVSCSAVKRIVYMDMYHCQSAPPERAPAGFTLQENK